MNTFDEKLNLPALRPEMLPTESDPLAAYLASIRGIPLLSQAEEYAHAVRLQTLNDLESARALVSAHLLLVVKIAMEHRRYCDSIMDMIQEGNIGLMMAVRRFDPQRKTRLAVYAAHWIKAYIRRFITKARPAALLSDEVDDGATLPTADPDGEQQLITAEQNGLANRAFRRALACLDLRQLDIVRGRHLAPEKETLEILAERFNVSKERVRQIESQALAKLKAEIIRELGGAVEAQSLLAGMDSD